MPLEIAARHSRAHSVRKDRPNRLIAREVASRLGRCIAATVAGMCGLMVGSATAQAPFPVAASTPPGAWPAEPLELASPGGLGRSGAIRAIIAPSAATLDPAGLDRFGGGWESGHRWIPLVELTLPGEATAPPSLASAAESIQTPTMAGAWVLESGVGTRVPVLTSVPAAANGSGVLNGYHIGVYPTAGSDRTDAYRPPEAFIEVTPQNRNLAISRHLALGQFLTKDQFDVWPKYLALDMRLVDKLELVIDELNTMGIRVDRLHVMSGFRTPQYNGPGGDGRASLSRHMWGDAADVWVDNDGDGRMDDLNGDGSIDLDDAAVMLRAVERVERKFPELIGGAETYPTTSTHGPYIHIDARGQRARW